MHQYLTSPPQTPLAETYSAECLGNAEVDGRAGDGEGKGGKQDKEKERELDRGVLWSPKKILKTDPDEPLYLFKQMTYIHTTKSSRAQID